MSCSSSQASVAASVKVASWLALAAAPVFALMAVLSVLFGSAPMAMCPMAGTPLTGMAVMYALMSVFHAAPWVRIISKACRG